MTRDWTVKKVCLTSATFIDVVTRRILHSRMLNVIQMVTIYGSESNQYRNRARWCWPLLNVYLYLELMAYGMCDTIFGAIWGQVLSLNKHFVTNGEPRYKHELTLIPA